MHLPKQLVNVVGLVVVLAIIAAGTLVVALPIVLQAQAVQSQTQQVASRNDAQQAAVDALKAKSAQQSEITADVDRLQVQIPAERQMDDVVAIATAAAQKSGATVQSVTPEADQQFVPRTGPATGVATTPAKAETSTSGTTASTGATQIPVTIIIDVTSPTQSAAFLDALSGTDGRVLQIVHATSTANQMTVSALAFYEAEAASTTATAKG